LLKHYILKRITIRLQPRLS